MTFSAGARLGGVGVFLLLGGAACGQSPTSAAPGSDVQPGFAPQRQDASAATLPSPYPVSAAPMINGNAILLSDPTQAEDGYFGVGVSLGPGLALVGEFLNSDVAEQAGAAHIFERTAASWQHAATLRADDANTRQRFGLAVSLDGNRALVGAPGPGADGTRLGAAYIFERNASSWAQVARLADSTPMTHHLFGESVSLMGTTALIGAPRGDQTNWDAGAAFVFERSAATWLRTAKLEPTGAGAPEHFGSSVSLSGSRALVGAPERFSAGAGAGYVFERNASGWQQSAELLPDDSAPADWFGGAVCLKGDRALLGAAGHDNGTANNFGAAYVFDFDGTWKQTARLPHADAVANQPGVMDVSLAGNLALVGYSAGLDNGTDSGSAYLFQWHATGWSEIAQYQATTAPRSLDAFGARVSLHGDEALISSHLRDDGPTNSGAAYIFGAGALGTPCTEDSACGTGRCVDGLCCDSSCSGACERCDLLPNLGYCSISPISDEPPACGGYRCNGEENGCPTSCVGSWQCADGHRCKAGACVPALSLGNACNGDGECASDHCSRGICCESACTRACERCDAPTKLGSCVLVEAGGVAKQACTPYTCNGTEAFCPEGCAKNADCAIGNHCALGSCIADLEGGEACDDAQACKDGHCTDGVCCIASECAPYRCGAAGVCVLVCTSSSQCSEGNQCSSAGRCEPGRPVTSSEQVQNGGCSSSRTGSHPPRSFGWLLLALPFARCRRRKQPSS